MKIGLTKRGNPFLVFGDGEADPGIELNGARVQSLPSFEFTETATLFGMPLKQAQKRAESLRGAIVTLESAIAELKERLTEHDDFRAWRASRGIEEPEPVNANTPSGREMPVGYDGEVCEPVGDPVKARLR